MKQILLYILLALPFSSYCQKQKYYLVHENLPGDIVKDMIYLLEKVSPYSWIETSDNKKDNAIILQKANHASFTSKESFRFQSNGKSLVTIISSSNEGLIFGFYKHLRSLGFKFYLPDELYTIIPSTVNVFGAKKDIMDGPLLQVRNFFGTGGFGTNNPDPQKEVQQSWNLWQIRNGFGTAYQLAGHRGETFILDNKATLLKNPSWLVTPLTGNDHSDQAIKLNYQNRQAMEYYTDWSIQPFTDKKFVVPPPGHSAFLSMEPSDGGGFRNDVVPTLKLPSVSDQVFGAANLAAQKLDKLFPKHPNIGVNLYAYSDHAAPPSFPLHPRVFVQIVPYQFQNVAYGPSFIKLWASKARRFGLYDYFKYPDAQFDLPGGITLQETMKRLIHSVQSGSEGTTYESSYSKFSTGIPLYVMARYMADGDAGWQKHLDGIIRDLYPATSQEIKSLFSLFYNEPSFSSSHLGNAVAYVQAAARKTKTGKEEQRIGELKAYLHFVHLVYQSRETKHGDLEARLVPLAENAWKLFPTKIIHSYRIMQLISYAFLNSDKNDPAFQRYQKLHLQWFPETPRDQTAWHRIAQGGLNTNDLFNKLVTRYPLSAKPASFSMSQVKAALSGQYRPAKSMVIGGDPTARGSFGVFAEKGTIVKIRYRLMNSQAPSLSISTVDQDYNSIEAIRLNQLSGETSFTLPAGETMIFINASHATVYRMEIRIDNGLVFFDGAPRGLVAFYKTLDAPINQYTYDPAYYPSFIFMPKDISKVDYKVQLNALKIQDDAGHNISSALLRTEHGGFEYRQFTLPAKNAGKIWKAQITGNYNYSFLNIPDRYYLLQEK